MEFRIEENAAIGLAEFDVAGIKLEMPSALPLVIMTEESATELCLELALQLKMIRGGRKANG
jgi:hypothetical protein